MQALEALDGGGGIPPVDADDVRWGIADGSASQGGDQQAFDLEAYLNTLKKAELVGLLMRAAASHPEIEGGIAHDSILASGDVDDIVERVRVEIASASAPEIWSGGWSDGGVTADYSRVESGLAGLLEEGHCDAIVQLAEELLEAGQDQSNRSSDDGEISWEIGNCMKVVARAIEKSSMSDVDKVVLAIRWALEDEYGLTGGIHAVTERKRSKRTWSGVADALARRLEGERDSGRAVHRDRYRRDRLSDWLVHALDAAGREGDADRVCEDEAVRNRTYVRWVLRLMAAKRLDDAAHWAELGIAAVQAELPGVAAKLRTHLCEMAQRRRRWPLVAAYLAEDFFERPGVPAFGELVAAADKAGCARAVRGAAAKFLETGKPPADSVTWPLPSTNLPRRSASRAGREEHWDVLRDLAIAEKRPADVLRWHDRITEHQRSRHHHASTDADLSVARAVSDTHPERAIELYRAAAERAIAEKQGEAYVRAGNWLGQVRELLHASKRGREWPALLAEVRELHRRKRRLMEVLDGLEGRPIVASKKASRSAGKKRR